MNITCRPISTYPWPETKERKVARFIQAGRATPDGQGGQRYTPSRRTPFTRTLEDLKYELAYLKARDVVLEVDLADEDLRRDGWPRAGSRMWSPRIVLSFQSKHGPLRYATDRYDWWEDNVRALALSLEALRAVDRHGVTRRGEQYAGWKALPAAGGSTTTMTAEAAAAVLAGEAADGSTTAQLLREVEAFRRTHRAARAQTHPDRLGSRTRWDQVEAAALVLAVHHGRHT